MERGIPRPVCFGEVLIGRSLLVGDSATTDGRLPKHCHKGDLFPPENGILAIGGARHLGAASRPDATNQTKVQQGPGLAKQHRKNGKDHGARIAARKETSIWSLARALRPMGYISFLFLERCLVVDIRACFSKGGLLCILPRPGHEKDAFLDGWVARMWWYNMLIQPVCPLPLQFDPCAVCCNHKLVGSLFLTPAYALY